MDATKKKALDVMMAGIEEKFGKGTIQKMGGTPLRNIKSISTGALSLDLAIGVGGVPRGCIIEIYGPEGSGKSTLCLSIVAQAQKAGGVAAYIDAEHAMDPEYAAKCGVNVNEMLISQPSSGEQGLEVVRQVVKSKAVDLVIVDSVAALVPQSELDGEIGDAQMGKQARMMSQAMRMLCAEIAHSGCCVVFINQLRDKIGVMFGNPETTPGGKALKFYAHVRIDIRKLEAIKGKSGEEAIGNHVKTKVVKNKVAPPFRTALFDIIFGKGVDQLGCLLATALERNIVSKDGTWYTFLNTSTKMGDRLGQGADQSRAYLEANPKTAEEMEKQVRSWKPPIPSPLAPTAKTQEKKVETKPKTKG